MTTTETPTPHPLAPRGRHVGDLRRASLIALALIACGPASSETLTTKGSTSETPSTSAGTEGSATTDAVGTTTAGATDVNATGSSTSATASATDPSSGTGTEEPLCGPPPEDVTAAFVIDDVDFWESNASLDEQCTVDAITYNDALISIDLVDCKAAPDDPPVTHTVEVNASPLAGAIDLSAGEQVTFALEIDAPWWWEGMFALRRGADQVVLAGFRGTPFLPQLAPGLFAPFSIDMVQKCDPPEPDGDTSCEFICGGDYLIARSAVTFTRDAQTHEQFQLTHGAWPGGPYEFVVEDAEFRYDIMVSDTPYAWFSFVLYRRA